MEKVSKSKYDMCLGMKYFHKILLACSRATNLQLNYIINSRIIGRVSKQRLFIRDLLFIERFTFSGDSWL